MLNNSRNFDKTDKVGISNILDHYAPQWRLHNIHAQQTFDSLFQLEGIPFSWFLQRLLSVHTIPPQFLTKQLLERWQQGKKVPHSFWLEQKEKAMRKMYYYNELLKIRYAQEITKKKDQKTMTGETKNILDAKPTILFLTYTNHIHANKEVFRLQSILQQIRQQKTMNEMIVTALPFSVSCLSAKKTYIPQNYQQNDQQHHHQSPQQQQQQQQQYHQQYQEHYRHLYQFVTPAIMQQSMQWAKQQAQEWKKITEEEKERWLSSGLWSVMKNPLNFYLSEEFLFLTGIHYYTFVQMLEETKIKAAVITSQNSIVERCLSAAAGTKKIPLVLVQHGAAMGSIDPNLQAPYLIAVFSPTYKRRLMQQGVPAQNIKVTGPLIFDDIFTYKQKKERKDRSDRLSQEDPLSQEDKSRKEDPSSQEHTLNKIKDKRVKKILILTGPFIEQNYFSHQEYFGYIKKILRELNAITDLQVTIKLHPREKTKKSYEKILHSEGIRAQVIEHTHAASLYQLICEHDLLINFSSTVAIEGIILDKIVMTIMLPGFSNPILQIMQDSKATINVGISEDIGTLMQKILGDRTVQKALALERKKFVKAYCGKVDGKSAQRVAKLLYHLGKR